MVASLLAVDHIPISLMCSIGSSGYDMVRYSSPGELARLGGAAFRGPRDSGPKPDMGCDRNVAVLLNGSAGTVIGPQSATLVAHPVVCGGWDDVCS